MKYILHILLVSIIYPISLSAQVDRDPPETMEAPVLRINSPSRIYGKVLDNEQKGIQSAARSKSADASRFFISLLKTGAK